MDVPAHAIRTRSCSLWFDGIVRARFHQGAEVEAEDARENLAAIANLTRGRRQRVLVDLRPVRYQSAEARALFAGPQAVAVSSAVALVVSSPLSRVIANFYLGFNRPESPTRLFDSVADAERWLATAVDPQ